MKALILFFASVFYLNSLNAKSIDFQKKYKFESYKKAKESKENYLVFKVKSKKMGFMISDIDGHVKEFEVKSNINAQKKIIKDINVKFKVKSMDTDNESRDEKLHEFCLDYKDNEFIEVKSNSNCLYENGNCLVDAKINILKKWYPIKIKLNITSSGGIIKVNGEAISGLKELNIPDPSILVAKLLNQIKIIFQVKLKL